MRGCQRKKKNPAQALLELFYNAQMAARAASLSMVPPIPA